MDKINQLGEERVGKLILQYSAPAIAGMVVYGLNRIVGNIFIGRVLGVEALAGFTAANTLTMIVQAFVMMMGTGSSALISILLGQKKRGDAKAALGNALLVSAFISAPLTLTALLAADPLMALFGASGKSLQYGATFLKVFSLGIVFQFWNTIFNSAIRAEGQPVKALLTNIVSFGTAAALIPLFIVAVPFGIAGAALGMTLSQFLVTLWLGAHFRGKTTALLLSRSDFRPNPPLVYRMIAIGLAPFSMQFLSACLSVVVNHIVVRWAGESGLAVMGVVFSLYFLLIMPAQGTSIGIQPIIGFNYGAEKHARVKRTVSLSMTFLICFCTAEFLAAVFFRGSLASLFLSGQNRILDLCGRALMLALLAFPLIGIQFVSSSYFQSTGKAGLAIAVNLFRSLFILIPFFFMPLVWGFDGVFLAYPLTDAAAAVLCATLLYWDRIKGGSQTADNKSADHIDTTTELER